MKKSIFERIMYDVPVWLVSTLVYGIGGSVLLLLMFGLPGCTIHEPLPGLCYTDNKGTYLCPEKYKVEVMSTPEAAEVVNEINYRKKNGDKVET